MVKRAPKKAQSIASRVVGHTEEDPGALLAHPQNFRRHPDIQRQALRGSMKELGWLKGVIVNRTTGRILDGHARVEEAISQGVKVPVDWVELSEQEELLALAVLDPITELAVQDDEALAQLLAEVQTENTDILAMLEEMRIPVRAHTRGLRPGADPDAVPPLPKTAETQPGDLIILGDHRLLCGDSTRSEDVALLMDGQKARLMNTDPPYGIDFVAVSQSKGQSAAYGDIANDGLDGPQLQQFLEEAIRTAVPHLVDDCAFYLWHPMLTQGTFFAAAAAAAADILIHRQIIWVKPSMVFGRGDYHWRHELCFYGWRRGHRPPFYGPRNQTTIWEMGRENDKIHPTQKPVALFETPILNHTQPGDIIYEPFAGSGSQFIAAEEHGRRCFGVEIDPLYCDVIARRWEESTGVKVERPERVER